MTETEKLTYLAGIIDGEGHFRTTPNKNGQGRAFIRPEIIVENLSEELIFWIQENFGGRKSMHIRNKVKHPTWQDIHRWDISGKKAVALAILVEPYLIVKKEQVKRLTRIEYDHRGWMRKETAFN